jgi:hypothetical protein
MHSQIRSPGKLHILEEIYRSGHLTETIDRAIDNLITLERSRVAHELADLQERLRAFEARYQMASDEFYRRYERGELGDSADFMEWSSFCDMERATQRHLDNLTGSLPWVTRSDVAE